MGILRRGRSHCGEVKEALDEVIKAREAWLKSARANGKHIPKSLYFSVIYQVA